MTKRPLIIIAGPTAVGKTKASVELAKAIHGEIISADSMQVYRMLDIGSAKIKKEEKEGVPHHLIDVLDPKEEFNVMIFRKMAMDVLEGIYERGHIPVICGGTGFYIQSVLYDISFPDEPTDRAYREMLYEKAEKEGLEALFSMLQRVDPESALRIPMNNVKRVARALEFYHEVGEPISAHNDREREKESPFDFRYFVLYRDRSETYERIDRRVDEMMKEGLLTEVKRLMDYGVKPEMTSMQGLGYKQLYQALLGNMTVEEAVERTKIETRHFAKRQITWFKREKDTIWVDVEKENLLDVYRIRPFS